MSDNTLILSKDQLLQAYRMMKTIREFEERVHVEFATGDLPGFVHLYAGEEAAGTGIMMHLHQEDYISSTHRGHGHCIAKGVDVKGMVAELYGRSSGTCHGKGGSMHIADNDLGHLGANAIVGGGISHVVGAGLSYKYLGKDQAAVAFFGDGAMQQGGLYESMNLAALWKLPVMFVCINNEYGMGTRLDRASASLEFAKRAETFGLNGLEVDGLDVTQVHHKAQKLMEGVRNGDSAFLKVDCYRFHGHARKDKSHYREDLEEQKGREKDPILHLEDQLIKGSFMTTGDLEQIKSEVDNEMDEAMEYALNSTEPESIQRFQDVYAPDSPEPLPVDERIRKALNAS
mgnify:CR=1 FL=1